MSNRLPLCCLTRQLPAGPPSTLRLGVYTETEARSVTQRVTCRVMREVTHTAPRWHAPCWDWSQAALRSRSGRACPL